MRGKTVLSKAFQSEDIHIFEYFPDTPTFLVLYHTRRTLGLPHDQSNIAPFQSQWLRTVSVLLSKIQSLALYQAQCCAFPALGPRVLTHTMVLTCALRALSRNLFFTWLTMNPLFQTITARCHTQRIEYFPDAPFREPSHRHSTNPICCRSSVLRLRVLTCPLFCAVLCVFPLISCFLRLLFYSEPSFPHHSLLTCGCSLLTIGDVSWHLSPHFF